MKISQLIQQLEQIQNRKGNIDVVFKDAEFGETSIDNVYARTQDKNDKYFYKDTVPIAVIQNTG